MNRSFAAVLIFLCALLAIPRMCYAQINPNAVEGMAPYSSFHGGDIDAVGLAKGLLDLHAPLFSYPQAGGKLHFGFTIRYVSASTFKTKTCPPKKQCTYFSGKNPGFIEITDDTGPFAADVIDPAYSANGSITMSDLTTHPLVPVGNLWRTADATGIVYNPATHVVTDRDGIQTTLNPNGTTGAGSIPLSVTDTNGNTMSYNMSTKTWTDTLGRTFPPSVLTTDTSACTGPLPITSAYLWTIPGPSGEMISLTLCEAQIAVGSTAATALQCIVLPNGTAWIFAYSDGDLTQITLPTGGTISYTWNTYLDCGQTSTVQPTFWVRRVATRTVNANDGTGPHEWTYNYSDYSTLYTGTATSTTTLTDPFGNQSVHSFTGVSCAGLYETESQEYQGSSSSGTLLKTVNTAYDSFADPYQPDLGSTPAFNVVPTQVTTTWPNGQVSTIIKSYDAGFTFGVPGKTQYPGLYGNLISEQEYDYGSGSAGPLLRTTTTQYMAFSNSAYLTNNLLSLPSSVQITNGSGAQVAYTTYAYGSATNGNLTSVSKWLNTTGAYVTNSFTYFSNGTVQTATDPNKNKTTYAYSSTYDGAYPTSITNALGQITKHAYDFNTGLVTSTTDPNLQVTTFSYDNMWRLACVTYPDHGQACITREETTFPFTATMTKLISTTPAVVNYVTTNVFDGMGRVSQSQLTSDSLGAVYTDTTYDANGRKYTVSNPYRTKTDPTYGVTSYIYDGIGRTCVVVPPDGTAVANTSCPTAQPSNDVFTAYAGNTTTVTDQQTKSRKSQTDSLGRLTNVWEDPAGLDYQTVYAYDALNDLVSVVQGGSHNRSFVYDSLKRLTSSTNPESGTVTYTYDTNGNELTKKDARSITITYGYDALNRITGKTYSNTDPAVTYSYDELACFSLPVCYNVGRLTGMTDANGAEAWNYDQMGREWAVQRATNGIIKNTAYTYDLNGDLLTLTYPSGRTITYTWDSAARPISAVDVANSINFATGAAYAPQGALSALTLATTDAPTNLSDTFNSRLQPNEMTAWSTANGTVFDLTYSFKGANNHNNGNVMGITNNVDNTRSQAFTYDSLNRIATGETTAGFATNESHCWGESYVYDQWGNLTSIGVASTAFNGCFQEGLSVSATTNNQLSGFSYDNSGNTTGDGTYTYGWDAEGRLVQNIYNAYDGMGNLVWTNKLYWYGADAEILEESDLSGIPIDDYVYFEGKRIARVDSNEDAIYYVTDMLESSRVQTEDGYPCFQSDIYPFGGLRVVYDNICGDLFFFEGKERNYNNLDDLVPAITPHNLAALCHRIGLQCPNQFRTPI